MYIFRYTPLGHGLYTTYLHQRLQLSTRLYFLADAHDFLNYKEINNTPVVQQELNRHQTSVNRKISSSKVHLHPQISPN